MPHVGDRRGCDREQQRPDDRRAVGMLLRRAIGADDRRMGAEPRRLVKAAGERPRARQAIAAVDGHRTALRPGAPGEHRARRAEHARGGVVLEICGDHRAPRRLTQHPRGARVGPGDLLHHLHERRRIELGAAERARQQHAEQAGVVQRVGERRGQPALGLRPIGVDGDRGRQLAHARDVIGCGGHVGDDGTIGAVSGIAAFRSTSSRH